jgi:hypothetical protein
MKLMTDDSTNDRASSAASHCAGLGRRLASNGHGGPQSHEANGDDSIHGNPTSRNKPPTRRGTNRVKQALACPIIGFLGQERLIDAPEREKRRKLRRLGDV